MRDFFKSVRFKILAGLLTLMVGFMIAAIYTGGSTLIVAQIINFVVEPAQRVSVNVTTSINSFFQKYFDTAKTYEENKVLREQVSDLRRQLVDYEKARYEYEQFLKIEDMRELHKDWQMSTASIIDRDHSTPFYSFMVDKGSLEGISQWDPVMTEDGLVGYVTEVGLSSSRVITLLDVNINVGAYNRDTRDPGIVTGTVEQAMGGFCLLEYLPRDSATAPGNIIVTNGGSLFPRDIIIGTVESVYPSGQGNSVEAVIRPAVDMGSIKDVFIITQFEGQGADESDSEEE